MQNGVQKMMGFCDYPMWSLPDVGTDSRCDHDEGCPKISKECEDLFGKMGGETCKVTCAGDPEGTEHGSEVWKCIGASAKKAVALKDGKMEVTRLKVESTDGPGSVSEQSREWILEGDSISCPRSTATCFANFGEFCGFSRKPKDDPRAQTCKRDKCSHDECCEPETESVKIAKERVHGFYDAHKKVWQRLQAIQFPDLNFPASSDTRNSAVEELQNWNGTEYTFLDEAAEELAKASGALEGIFLKEPIPQGDRDFLNGENTPDAQKITEGTVIEIDQCKYIVTGAKMSEFEMGRMTSTGGGQIPVFSGRAFLQKVPMDSQVSGHKCPSEGSKFILKLFKTAPGDYIDGAVGTPILEYTAPLRLGLFKTLALDKDHFEKLATWTIYSPGGRHGLRGLLVHNSCENGRSVDLRLAGKEAGVTSEQKQQWADEYRERLKTLEAKHTVYWDLHGGNAMVCFEQEDGQDNGNTHVVIIDLKSVQYHGAPSDTEVTYYARAFTGKHTYEQVFNLVRGLLESLDSPMETLSRIQPWTAGALQIAGGLAQIFSMQDWMKTHMNDKANWETLKTYMPTRAEAVLKECEEQWAIE